MVLVIIGSICAIIIVLGLIYNCWQRRLPKMKNMVSTEWVQKVAKLLALGMEGIGKLREVDFPCPLSWIRCWSSKGALSSVRGAKLCSLPLLGQG